MRWTLCLQEVQKNLHEQRARRRHSNDPSHCFCYQITATLTLFHGRICSFWPLNITSLCFNLDMTHIFMILWYELLASGRTNFFSSHSSHLNGWFNFLADNICTKCHKNATCISNRCVCMDGFYGDGFYCRRKFNLSHDNLKHIV